MLPLLSEAVAGQGSQQPLGSRGVDVERLGRLCHAERTLLRHYFQKEQRAVDGLDP
ncbi:hypothetical protein GCM10023063_23670 [Arthrobacter methylotrophus]